MCLEFLLIYKQVGPSKTEIIAKRSNFQRNIWKNLEKNFRTRITKIFFWRSVSACTCVIFFVLIKNTHGNLIKIQIPLAPLQKCPKNYICSLIQHFLAFLDSLDTLWNYSLATLACNLLPGKKIVDFENKMCPGKWF